MQPDRSRAAEMVAVVSCAGILATGLVSAFGSVGWTLATAAASLAAIAAAVAARPALARVPGWVPSWAFRLDVDGQVLTYPSGEGPEPLCAWARAHDLDPHCVVVPQTAMVRDGWLTLQMYRVDAAGNKYMDPADHTRAARETVTVRLMDNPPDCWIRREVSHGTA